MNSFRGLILNRASGYSMRVASVLSIYLLAACGSTHAQGGGTSATAERDPFWPVGYQPKTATKAVETKPQQAIVEKSNEDWKAAMKLVMVSGVSQRGETEYCAVINGELKVVGETITVLYNGAEFTWTVAGIAPPASIKLKRLAK